MSRAVLHDGTTVVNVVEYDPDEDWTPPEGLTLDVGPPKGVGPRWVVNGDGTYDPPGPPEPTSPTPKEQANEKAAGVITDAPGANSIAALREQVIALAEAVKTLTDG